MISRDTPTLDKRRRLIDKSALVRLTAAPDWADWANRTAGLAGLVLLHLDKDFELIGNLTGQPTERLSHSGS